MRGSNVELMYLGFADEVVVVVKLDANDFAGDSERGENIKQEIRILRRRTEHGYSCRGMRTQALWFIFKEL